ncbi:MAG TPA: hypothetical protein VIA81_02095 [Acidimicrobiia bacterium]|jgi:hypothetical protein
MSRFVCRLTSPIATFALVNDGPLPWPLRSHARSCLQCQAHLASVRITRRRLREMRAETATPPEGFDPGVADQLEQATRWAPPTSFRPAATRVATSAAAAGLAIAAAWWWRRTRAGSPDSSLAEAGA